MEFQRLQHHACRASDHVVLHDAMPRLQSNHWTVKVVVLVTVLVQPMPQWLQHQMPISGCLATSSAHCGPMTQLNLNAVVVMTSISRLRGARDELDGGSGCSEALSCPTTRKAGLSVPNVSVGTAGAAGVVAAKVL
jgi:hypothetical protein